jgi:aspartyl-tRNA(Asn)/glutamyl-tRNA(Gln) amidotransferase subunit A
VSRCARRSWEAFAHIDVLCTPTLPCRVPDVGATQIEVGGEEESVVAAMTRFTAAWNLTGMPAGTVPAGRDRNGAPVGVQLAGAWWDEPTVLRAMAALESGLGGLEDASA